MDIKEAFKHLENMPFDRRIQCAIDDLTDIISDCRDDGYTYQIQDLESVIHSLKHILEISEAIKTLVVGTIPAPTAG